jgi:predicted HAD superfamily Cof-like phosphohydrolase
MTEEQQLVRIFHEVYLRDNRDTPTLLDDAMLAFRCRLLNEEAGEFEAAAQSRDLVEMTDALADMLYVILGTANVFGIDLEPVFREVHRSNMTKLPPSGERQKPVKGPEWSPPDMRGELLKQGWRPDRSVDASPQHGIIAIE